MSVNRSIIDRWVTQNGPDAVAKLAIKSQVSSATISQARRGIVPRKPITRQLICEALGVPESELFPVLQDEKESA